MIPQEDLDRVKEINNGLKPLLIEVEELPNEKVVNISIIKPAMSACLKAIEYLTELILKENEDIPNDNKED